MSDVIDIFSSDDEELQHYGMPRRSGRYPWGSGDNPYQHEDRNDIRIGGTTPRHPGKNPYSSENERALMRATYAKNEEFLKKLAELEKQGGLAEIDIAKKLGCRNTSELRARRKAATNTNRKIDISEIDRLKAENPDISQMEIHRRTGIPYSTITSLMKASTRANVNKYTNTIDILKNEVEKKKYVYVGIGTEDQLDISKDHLTKALEELRAQGYAVESIKAEQQSNPGNYTTIRVLAGPGEDMKSISRHRTEIKPIVESPFANENANVFGIERPVAVDSSRIYIRYPDDPTGNGALQDGTIQIRRGVDDLYLGPNKTYSQVRINVDDKSYLKGMALYGGENDIPEGYDIVFNTSKPRGTDVMNKIFKPLKRVDEKDPDSPIDWQNPFGAAIKSKEQGGQLHYIDISTGETKLGAINKVNDEDDWDDWSVTLSSQFLSKQPVKLIKQQLDKTYEDKLSQYNKLIDIPDSPVKEKLLQDFADGCDSDAVHLKAIGFKGQSQKVLLPMNDLAPGEIYAPAYPNGTRVILVRHPHQGTFEIPILTVNNNNPKAKEVLGNVQDAVGIRGDTAQQLSGADYDGDTASVIPVTGIEKDFNIREPFEELQFDPKAEYAKPEGAPKTGKAKEVGGRKFNKGMEMGKISNLITDMTMQDPPDEDIIKATRHALVVIDAEKHNLDWVRSEEENDIKELKRKYQGGPNKGASTLISRSKHKDHIPEIGQHTGRIDPETGLVSYSETGNTTLNKKGEKKLKESEVFQMTRIRDARQMMSNPESGYPQEELYAEFANNLMHLADSARKSSVGLGYTYNPSAAQTYAKEVASLNAKLNTAIKNKPYESLAQIRAAAIVSDYKKNHMSHDLPKEEYEKELKKIRNMATRGSRDFYGAQGGKSKIAMTENEWEAIMAGALTKNKVNQILANTKTEVIKQYALPKEKVDINPYVRELIFVMNASTTGTNNPKYSLADIAEQTGLSTSVIRDVLKKKI